MTAIEKIERIREEPIIANVLGSPLYWTRLVETSNNGLLAYALRCTEKDLDFCIFDGVEEELKIPLEKKINEISLRVNHDICRITRINNKGGIVKTEIYRVRRH